MFTDNDVLIKKINSEKAICIVKRATLDAHGISREKLEHGHPSAKKLIQKCMGILMKSCFTIDDLLKFVMSCNKNDDLVITAEKIDTEAFTGILDSAEHDEVVTETFDIDEKDQFSRIFACKDMPSTIRFAKALGKMYGGKCSLYLMKGQYYLLADEMTSEEYANAAMLNDEFALGKEKASYAYYQEHGKLIIDGDALEKLGQL